MAATDVDALYEKIMSLNELVWEGRADRPAVDLWLEGFRGECTSEYDERKHALYLLSKFLYFGQTQVRQLLRSMFQDLIRHHLSAEVREGLTDKNDFAAVHQGFLEEMDRTRFVGLGKPAESGPYLLYQFRQENGIPVDACVSLSDLFTGPYDDPASEWALPGVNRVIFIDDFCGTGDQAADISKEHLPWMRRAAKRSGDDIDAWYLTLLATTGGLEKLRGNGFFDRVRSVSELDETYRVFAADSQVFANSPDDLAKSDAELIARHYGELLNPGQPLGYKNSQLLIGFQHNVPDNTLPIMSRERVNPPWHPIFPRIDKV